MLAVLSSDSNANCGSRRVRCDVAIFVRIQFYRDRENPIILQAWTCSGIIARKNVPPIHAARRQHFRERIITVRAAATLPQRSQQRWRSAAATIVATCEGSLRGRFGAPRHRCRALSIGRFQFAAFSQRSGQLETCILLSFRLVSANMHVLASTHVAEAGVQQTLERVEAWNIASRKLTETTNTMRQDSN